jgi:2,3-bisphosphoglycerate-independent phosphoglycerate mutase
MNLVSLLVGSSEVYMEDFSAGHISTAEAKQLVEYIGREMAQEGFEYYPGVSYRHLLVWRNGEDRAKTTPPHDITEQPIHRHLPTGPGSDTLLGLITGSQILLKDHPVNRARQEAGKLEANSIWLWGQGRAPRMETYAQKFGIGGGTVVSAVDLLKGIGKMAGLECPEIAGATGYIDTNYEAKVAAALDALKRSDFVFVHLEAPDESGHQGNFEHKVKAIEDFDARVVGPVWQALETSGEEFQLLVMPDHPTPLARRTHTSEAVPFALLESRAPGKKPGGAYTEKAARATGLHVEKAHRLMAHMTGRDRLW